MRLTEAIQEAGAALVGGELVTREMVYRITEYIPAVGNLLGAGVGLRCVSGDPRAPLMMDRITRDHLFTGVALRAVTELRFPEVHGTSMRAWWRPKMPKEGTLKHNVFLSLMQSPHQGSSLSQIAERCSGRANDASVSARIREIRADGWEVLVKPVRGVPGLDGRRSTTYLYKLGSFV